MPMHRHDDEEDSMTTKLIIDMPTYREQVIQALTSIPPGSHDRLYKLEELRMDVVNEFATQLALAEEVVRRQQKKERRIDVHGLEQFGQQQQKDEGQQNVQQQTERKMEVHGLEQWGMISSGANGDNPSPVNDKDDEGGTTIYDEFAQYIAKQRKQLDQTTININTGSGEYEWQQQQQQHHQHQQQYNNNHDDRSSPHTAATNIHKDMIKQHLPSINDARQLLIEARNYLPQLVSTVLHSPPSLLPPPLINHHQQHHQHQHQYHHDAISVLRSLLITQCTNNPSMGIELCWLLEAEVGRKWKALFEHRQLTGRRLILIVQSDIALVIAAIGAEKASAFNLLQDVEMATAFGIPRWYETIMDSSGSSSMDDTTLDHHQQHHHHDRPSASSLPQQPDTSNTNQNQLSISDLRCRHFGDSMHFIDYLTRISLELRCIYPISHRQSYLHSRLYEINRRLNRRMITRGLVSIDVEVDEFEESMYYNNQQQHNYQQHYPYGRVGGSYNNHHHPTSPLQWSEEDVQEDMIRHSVTFPMVPLCSSWPGGGVDVLNDSSSSSSSRDDDTAVLSNEDTSIGGSSCIVEGGRFCAVRALRILPETCRVLSSATRCPFLVRMEVVDTGLDADDIRLYYNSEKVDDDVQSPPTTTSSNRGESSEQQQQQQQSYTSKRESLSLNAYESHSLTHPGCYTKVETPILSRGGGGYPDHTGNSVTDYGYDSWPDTYDTVREQHYEELHHTLRQQREVGFDYVPRVSYNNNDNSNNMIQSSIPIQHQKQHQPQQLSTGSVLLDNVFGRSWNVECELIRQQSPYRNVKGWRLASFIIKAGEDIRREALVMQCITKLWTWFQDEIPDNLRPYLRPYTIMCVGGDAGIVECLSDVRSVNEIKKETEGFTTLRDFFERAYGPPRQENKQQPSNNGVVSFEKARDNFLRSLVGYSVVCYILQIKDRHNANILMDREGHIMHIDFGFVLGETPKMGKVPLFSERAPFKLSAEFWEVIGGWRSFKRFCEMFEAAYSVASAHSDEICSLVEAAIMNVSRNTDLARSIADGVRGRMQMKADPKEQKIFIINIVNDAITSWGTSTYDWLQRSMHGYQ